MGVALLEPRGIPSVASIGECMIELREMPDGRLTRGYGGDVLNTAVYLSRLLKKRAEVRFSSIIGDDPFSTEMIAAWKKRCIRATKQAFVLAIHENPWFISSAGCTSLH